MWSSRRHSSSNESQVQELQNGATWPAAERFQAFIDTERKRRRCRGLCVSWRQGTTRNNAGDAEKRRVNRTKPKNLEVLGCATVAHSLVVSHRHYRPLADFPYRVAVFIHSKQIYPVNLPVILYEWGRSDSDVASPRSLQL